MATNERRPLAQFLGLVVAEYLNPTRGADVAEVLEIFRDGEKVNELHATGTPAALELVKLFIFNRNDPKGAKVWQTINPQGLHKIEGRYSFAGAGASYVYIYHFKGAALENLPTF